jgi:hypothetical protein
MNFMDFNPYLVQEHQQQVLREVNSLRLQNNCASRGSRILALATTKGHQQ